MTRGSTAFPVMGAKPRNLLAGLFVLLAGIVMTVSYTHLTLPTNREV